MLRPVLIARLKPFSLEEIKQALEILSESDDADVNTYDIRRVWDRVSVALDRHQDDDNPLTDLEALELDLSVDVAPY